MTTEITETTVETVIDTDNSLFFDDQSNMSVPDNVQHAIAQSVGSSSAGLSSVGSRLGDLPSDDSQSDDSQSGDSQSIGSQDNAHAIDVESAQWIQHTLDRLSHSTFRSKFVLSDKDRAYARAKGKVVIDRHAHELLRSRVGDAEPRNDGKQTPWRGHPVFTAQHATACCCRGCIAKWHHIPQGRALSDEEVDRLARLIMAWIERDLTRHPAR